MAQRYLMRVVQSVVFGSATMLLAGAGGCGSADESAYCDQDGCYQCDAYGCRPSTATPTPLATCDPSRTTCSCQSASECTGGLSCLEGLCLKACQFSTECGQGRICANGKCVVGCDAQTPCSTGYSCNLTKSLCEVDASNPQCSAQKPCTGGLLCVAGVCQGGCKANADCAQSEICDTSSSTCIKDPQPKPDCASDASVCGSSRVCKNGYCMYPCTDSAGCEKIDARIPVCSEGICRSETEAHPACTRKEQCATGQDCVSNKCL
jgi:hypothetical protein